MNPSERIDKLIEDTADWRGKMLAEIRRITRAADPKIVEEWKWMGTPVWSHDGIVFLANPHKDKVKLTFPHGASLPDPDKIFNNGFGGKQWRAIDFYEDDKIDERALKKIIRAAVAHNHAALKRKAVAAAHGSRAKAHK